MTSILATTAAPAVPVQIKAAARVAGDRDSAPVFLLEPLPDHGGASAGLAAGETAGGVPLPASTQPLAPSTMAMMLEVQERTADRGRFRARWAPTGEDLQAEADNQASANLVAAVRGYGRRRAA